MATRKTTPASKDAETGQPDFEARMQQLEQIVAQLESGELSLEQSLAAYEQGMQLTRECQAELDTAQQRIDKLTEKDGQTVIEPFDDAEESQ